MPRLEYLHVYIAAVQADDDDAGLEDEDLEEDDDLQDEDEEELGDMLQRLEEQSISFPPGSIASRIESILFGDTGVPYSTEMVQEELDARGAEGWELVSMVPHWEWREHPSLAPDPDQEPFQVPIIPSYIAGWYCTFKRARR